MFSTLKGYLIAATGVVVALFLAVFSYRGKKIESLKSDNEALKDNSDKLEALVEQKQKEVEIREAINEIYSESSSVDDDAEWLRSRARNKNSKDS